MYGRRGSAAAARFVIGMYPHNRGNTGRDFLYAFGLMDGRVKIGRTRKPRERFVQHFRSFEKSIVWTHLFAPVPSGRIAHAAEHQALNAASLAGSRRGKTEFFDQLDKQQAIAAVRSGIASATRPKA